MRIKMQQRQRFAVFFNVSEQQWVGNVVVATESQHFRIAVVDDVTGVLGNRILDGPRIVGIKKAIAILTPYCLTYCFLKLNI